MPQIQPPAGSRAATPKGQRQADGILEAAIVCLGKDGYAATSIQRIADQAGVGKRAVIYYFGSRERLIQRVIERISDRLLTELGASLTQGDEPADVARRSFRRLWQRATDNRALLAAYYGLVAEGVTNREIREYTRQITDRFRTQAAGSAIQAQNSGVVFRLDPVVATEMIIAGFHGLVLLWLEGGTTPAFEQALSAFEDWLARLVVSA